MRGGWAGRSRGDAPPAARRWCSQTATRRSLEDLERLCTATVSRFGRIDGLVNNAGVNFVKPVLEVTEEEWDRVIDIDLKGAFFLSQFVARRMVAQRPAGAAIVQIASVHIIAAVFLLSDAARDFTGANLLADLGMTSLLVGREPCASRPITGA